MLTQLINRSRLESAPSQNNFRSIKMGKYALGWFLGVPVFVLVIIYFFMN